MASDDYSEVSCTTALLCGDMLNVQDRKLWSTVLYGLSFWAASVLTFWSLTVYLCVNVYDRTSRPNYVFICIYNYVAKYVNGLRYKILSL